MGWFRRLVSEVELGLSLFGASFAGIDPNEILRSARSDGTPAPGRPAAPPAADGLPPPCAGTPSSGAGVSGPPPGAGVSGPPAVAAQPPLGHPERLVPHQPLTDEERQLWSQLR